MGRTSVGSGASSRALRRWSPTRKLSCDGTLSPELVDALWQGDVDELVYSATPLQVKDRCVVARIDDPAGSLLIKRHTWGGLGRTLRTGWREASARRCARLGIHLADAGIPTPRPRAYVEQRIGPVGYRSYLVTDFVPGTSLYRFIRFGSHRASVLAHLANQVAEIWERLVELGVNHNDLKPENFIVDESLGVWLIDLEKVRLDSNSAKMQRRQVADVKNFLHPRGWHHHGEARDMFHHALVNTSFGGWLDDVLVEEDADADLSVVIVCDATHGVSAAARQAIESVEDIADEVVLVAPGANGGRLDVLRRIDLVPKSAAENRILRPWQARTGAPNVARCPWVLMLNERDSATPFLAKEIHQRIAEGTTDDAFRIPVETHCFGRCVVSPEQAKGGSVRLFRQRNCSYSVGNGVFAITADPERTGQLTGKIQACELVSVGELVDRLNARSNESAARRRQKGERGQLLRAAVRAGGEFWKSYLWRGQFRSGWAGLQMSGLEAAFVWIEEAKLRQLASQFSADGRAELHPDSDVLTEEFGGQFSAPRLADGTAKAA